MPEIYPRLSIAEYWTIGISGAIILFTSVLLHELAHSTIALKYGINVNQIILFIFGGVSDIEETSQEESSKDFRKEFKIAIVGPITSFIIAGILGLSWLILSSIIVADKFDKLITSLRTAVDNDGSLDKEATSYDDILDAFRLALKFYQFVEKSN